MAGERPDIRLTNAETLAFLATQPRVVVVALDHGTPVGTVAGAEVADGAWRITVERDDEVSQLLATDDRVCVLVDQFPSYREIKGVIAHGRAHHQTVEGGRLTFALDLDDVASFDFAKVGAPDS